MFAAQLSGKFSRHEEDMEDVLTSSVFGIWKYLRPQLGLIQFLGSALRMTDREFLNKSYDLSAVENVSLRFWPWLKEPDSKGAEPDILIVLNLPFNKRLLVLVEAKYLSGKSSLRDDSPFPNDQLAREMDNLRKFAKRKGYDDFILIYVTAHTIFPAQDIEEAMEELLDKVGNGFAENFYWTTWRRLPSILSEVKVNANPLESKLLVDLREILKQQNLMFFEGITATGWNLGTKPWEFHEDERSQSYNWDFKNRIPTYVFGSSPLIFNWICGGNMKNKWRFNL